jgi:hypothetical protein
MARIRVGTMQRDGQPVLGIIVYGGLEERSAQKVTGIHPTRMSDESGQTCGFIPAEKIVQQTASRIQELVDWIHEQSLNDSLGG